MMRRLLLALAAILAAPSAAVADCTNVAFDPAQFRRLDGSDVYEPFDGVTYIARYGLTLRRGPNEGVADCALYVIGAGNGPERFLQGPIGGKIAYVLDRTKDRPLAFPVGTRAFDPADAFPLTVPAAANSTAEAVFLVRIPANQIGAPAGEYTDATLDLEARSAVGFAPIDRTPVPLTLTVAPAVQILLAGNRTEGVVDFKELERGETGFAALYVTANTPYDLHFAADSAAVGPPALRRLEGNAYDDAWSLPYQTTLDGAPVSFDAPLASRPSPGDARRALRFRVTGNPERVRAGRYRDVVTIEIRARP